MEDENMIDITTTYLKACDGTLTIYEATDRSGNSALFVIEKDISIPIYKEDVCDLGCITLANIRIKETNIPPISSIILNNDFYENVGFDSVKERIVADHNVYSVEAFEGLLLAVLKGLNIPTWTDDGSDLLERFEIVKKY